VIVTAAFPSRHTDPGTWQQEIFCGELPQEAGQQFKRHPL
jgi:hypothetical protein